MVTDLSGKTTSPPDYCQGLDPRRIGDMGAFFGHIFWKKDILFASKQISFLTVSNEFFFKTQGTSLGTIAAPKKGLE